jgi:hypothetical protein
MARGEQGQALLKAAFIYWHNPNRMATPLLQAGQSLWHQVKQQLLRLIVLHFGRQFGLDKRMKSVRSLRWALMMIVLAISGLPALADDNYLDMPLTQARFDRLIPTSYPTTRAKFNRLIPTTLPLIQPGIARIHITENLVYPLSQPLLIVSERPESWAASLSQRPRPRARARAVSSAW